MTRFVATTPDDRGRLIQLVSDTPLPFTVSIAKGASRSLSQNALMHKWFAEIAKHTHSDTAEIKAQCHLRWARAILLRDDPDWTAAFNEVLDPLPYATQVRAVIVLDIPFTRRMNVKQMQEYMDLIEREYRLQGVRLTDPEARKYAGEMGAQDG